ncbi:MULTISPECIES: selenide, water dikinase SelD [unclassified Synechococcus]|uniref:selenide, water dikinase SelD n=1 Tax=unclassified Synechococcus TaxID=2626047 RepID=UPI001CF8070D|nr:MULTISPECIES: selenide, water dikinase SelD [unclassified Synechococcus]MCB4378419.1 selenide, water dikinase SelD [Synechococcus sp. MU1650]MCB4412058.1 selenide, water dikinase SelD [Synechococcus sp. MU1611]
MTAAGGLILAGGGHSHALLLKRWAMRPERRPEHSITLVNRSSTTLYSGMVPGLIAALYKRDELAIDLRQLCDRAGVAFVEAEITGLNPQAKCLRLRDRPALHFDWLSLDVGSVSRPSAAGIPIKPLEASLAFLESENPADPKPLRVIGAGAAGLEVVLALRRRWPQRELQLQQRSGQLNPGIQEVLQRARIALIENDTPHSGPNLLCTGSQGPDWLATTGLPLDPNGRIRTDRCLRVEDHPSLFASGDCAVISGSPRPASGVWAVRAGRPLATNLEAACQGQPLRPWHPQRQALQLIGSHQDAAWARWGSLRLGPSPLLWRLKQRIDRAFMDGFQPPASMADAEPMACRGCAAKLPAQPLEAALERVRLRGQPEDAARVPGDQELLQSVDGFPALVSDPWLNGRLTTLHACSDLWACGAAVSSAMATITLPMVPTNEQQELLVQTLAGIRSVLDEQGAELIGGHTMESRSPAPVPASLGVQVTLTVNGASPSPWLKSGLRPGDALLISRPLGTGVLFAGAMAGASKAADLDAALREMACSQHMLLEQIEPIREGIHACTDITGFGLLGHLGEMLQNSPELIVKLDGPAIPAYPGALDLFERGVSSTLAPSNRAAWRWLEGPIQLKQHPSAALLELLVDPQTCGPLLLACSSEAAAQLTQNGLWLQIGNATAAHG